MELRGGICCEFREWIPQVLQRRDLLCTQEGFAVSSVSGSYQDHPLQGTEGCQGRHWDPGAPAIALIHPVLLITPWEAARPEETEEMKLIHGNVSLFSHLLLGAGLLLPVTPVQPGLWLVVPLREPSLGRNIEDGGFQREKDCSGVLELLRNREGAVPWGERGKRSLSLWIWGQSCAGWGAWSRSRAGLGDAG